MPSKIKMLFLVYLSSILISCIGQDRDSKITEIKIKNKEHKELQIEHDTLELSGRVDSLYFFCFNFGYYSNIEFNIYFSNINFEIDQDRNDKRKKIESLKKRNRLIAYINMFYIDKTEKIILYKKDGVDIESNYPFIRVWGFENKRIVFKKDIFINDELVLNPKFLDFYDFLDSLYEYYY